MIEQRGLPNAPRTFDALYDEPPGYAMLPRQHVLKLGYRLFTSNVGAHDSLPPILFTQGLDRRPAFLLPHYTPSFRVSC